MMTFRMLLLVILMASTMFNCSKEEEMCKKEFEVVGKDGKVKKITYEYPCDEEPPKEPPIK